MSLLEVDVKLLVKKKTVRVLFFFFFGISSPSKPGYLATLLEAVVLRRKETEVPTG